MHKVTQDCLRSDIISGSSWKYVIKLEEKSQNCCKTDIGCLNLSETELGWSFSINHMMIIMWPVFALNDPREFSNEINVNDVPIKIEIISTGSMDFDDPKVLPYGSMDSNNQK